MADAVTDGGRGSICHRRERHYRLSVGAPTGPAALQMRAQTGRARIPEEA